MNNEKTTWSPVILGGDQGGIDDDAEEVPLVKLDKASAQNAADMEKVTDFKEEKEFSRGGNASVVSCREGLHRI